MKLEGNLGIFIPFDIQRGQRNELSRTSSSEVSPIFLFLLLFLSSRYFYAPFSFFFFFFFTVRSKVLPDKILFYFEASACSYYIVFGRVNIFHFYLKKYFKIIKNISYNIRQMYIIYKSVELKWISFDEKKREDKYNKIFQVVDSLSHRQIPCSIRQLSRRIRASLSARFYNLLPVFDHILQITQIVKILCEYK